MCTLFSVDARQDAEEGVCAVRVCVGGGGGENTFILTDDGGGGLGGGA